MYKCEICGKEYTREDYYLKHIKKCENNIIKKVTYSDDELYMINFFKNFNPSRIEVKNPVRDNFIRIYREKYNRKINCDCASEYVKMYMFLFKKTKELK